METRRRPLPAPGDALLGGDASRAFRRGFGDFTRFYGMLIDSLDTAYLNGFSYNDDAPGRAGGRSGAVRSARRRSSTASSGASSCANGTSVVKPAVDRGPSRDAGRRPRRAVRRGAGRVPDALPRPPRGDDLPAHALHGGGDGPDRRLPRARRRLDRAAVVRAARPDARRGAGLGGRLRRARAAGRRDRGGPRRAASCSSPTATPAACSRRCARSTATRARRSSGYLDLVGCRLLDGFDISGPCALELPDVLLRAIRVAVDRQGREDVRRRAADRGRPRQGPRGASGRVRRAARRGAADLPASATSAASSATSGRRG